MALGHAEASRGRRAVIATSTHRRHGTHRASVAIFAKRFPKIAAIPRCVSMADELKSQ